jgi:hypothetical protein
MASNDQNQDAWWHRKDGWVTEGIKTPMRRCGHCKDDITIGSGHDRTRGLCRVCLPVFDDHIFKEAKRLETERAAALKATTVAAPAPVKTTPEPREEREYRPMIGSFDDMVDDQDRYDDAGNY